MLHTVLEQDMLKTWTISQEQSGNIVVKLRFYGTHGGQGSLNLATGDHGGELSFKRKSAKQNLRDRERARSYHQQKNTPNSCFYNLTCLVLKNSIKPTTGFRF